MAPALSTTEAELIGFQSQLRSAHTFRRCRVLCLLPPYISSGSLIVSGTFKLSIEFWVMETHPILFSLLLLRVPRLRPSVRRCVCLLVKFVV